MAGLLRYFGAVAHPRLLRRQAPRVGRFVGLAWLGPCRCVESLGQSGNAKCDISLSLCVHGCVQVTAMPLCPRLALFECDACVCVLVCDRAIAFLGCGCALSCTKSWCE